MISAAMATSTRIDLTVRKPGASHSRPRDSAGRGRAVPSPRTSLATVRALGLVQIDSVNVLVRSHYLPLFSRLGAYDRGALDRGGLSRPSGGRLFEYWGHEASLLPVETQPLLRWRMERARQGVGVWSGVAAFGRQHRGVCAAVLDEIRDRGPLGVSDLRAERQAARRLVGLERGQGRARVAVLDGAGEHAQPSPLRADLRPHGARAAGTRRRCADAGRGRRAARVAARLDRARSASRPSATCATTSGSRSPTPRPASPSSSKRAISAGRRGGLDARGVSGSARARAPLGASTRARCCRRSTRSSGSARAPSGSSTSATGSRSTRPPHKREHGYYVLPFLLGERIVGPRRPEGRSFTRRAARGLPRTARLVLASRNRGGSVARGAGRAGGLARAGRVVVSRSAVLPRC